MYLKLKPSSHENFVLALLYLGNIPSFVFDLSYKITLVFFFFYIVQALKQYL